MWSYPIIRNGLICVIDVRNGLYILRYTEAALAAGRRHPPPRGNSDLGDTLRLAGINGG
jgi:hypothetical protein